jgi:hypothetical protein
MCGDEDANVRREKDAGASDFHLKTVYHIHGLVLLSGPFGCSRLQGCASTRCRFYILG